MLENINKYTTLTATILVLAFLWYTQFNPIKTISLLTLIVLAAISILGLYLSKIFIKLNNNQTIPTMITTTLLIFLILFFYGQQIITQQPKTANIPGTQSILSFIFEDLIGIPMWMLAIAAIAIMLFILRNPILGIGMALILLGVILFFITPLMPFDDIISAGTGLVLSILGITRKGSQQPIPGQQPIIIMRQ